MSFMSRKYIVLIMAAIMPLIGISGFAKADGQQVTVLIVLEPHKASGKSWDIGEGADPVVCLDHGCYVGRGYIAPAKYFRGKSAFLPAVHARACRNRLSCIYRDIHFPDKQSKVWAVDLDGFKRDYMPSRIAEVDHSCIIESRHLRCFNGVFTAEYSMWIVPEHTADRAGKKVLDYALYRGLHDAREKYIENFLEEKRKDLPETVSKFYELILGDPVPSQCAYDSEVITEAFYLSGIFESTQRRSESFINNLITKDYFSYRSKKTPVSLKDFWDFHKALNLLEMYADADRKQEFSHQKGLRYHDNGKQSSLVIGWDVKSRADKIISECVTSTVAKAG